MCPISLHCHLTGWGEGSLEGWDPRPPARRQRMEHTHRWEKVSLRSFWLSWCFGHDVGCHRSIACLSLKFGTFLSYSFPHVRGLETSVSPWWI